MVPGLIALGCGGQDHATRWARHGAIAAKISPLPAEPAPSTDTGSSDADDVDFETVLIPDHDVRVSGGRGDADRLRAELRLHDAYRDAVHSGQSVTVVPVAGGRGALARVTRVDPIDPASRTFRVVIDLDPRGTRLQPGMSIHALFDPPLSRN